MVRWWLRGCGGPCVMGREECEDLMIPNYLVRELVAVDRLATRAVVVGEVTALQHEALAMVVVVVVVVVVAQRALPLQPSDLTLP